MQQGRSKIAQHVCALLQCHHLTTLGTRSSAIMSAEPGRYVALGWRGVKSRLPSCMMAYGARQCQPGIDACEGGSGKKLGQ